MGGDGNERYLPGVKTDGENYQAFFMSDNGGAWNDKEVCITVPTNKRCLELLVRLMSYQTEYLVFVYLGHSYEDQFGYIHFGLPRGEEFTIRDLREWSNNKKCLFIADSCRSVIPIYESGGTIKTFSAVKDSTYRLKCRRMYDESINNVPMGSCTKVFSALSKQSAGEMPNAKGGIFSCSLLETARNFANGTGYSQIYNIKEVVTAATSLVQRRSQGDQTPEVYEVRGNLPPFIVKP